MKMNDHEIQRIYRESIQEKVLPERGNCPSPEKIWGLFGSSVSRKQSEELIDHITNCAHCLKEFDGFLALFRDEMKFIKLAKDIFGQKGLRQTDRMRRKFKISLSSLSWKYPFIAALTIVLVFLMTLATFKFFLPKKAEKREALSSPIRLIEPRQAKKLQAPIVFRWEEMPEREHYVLEIFSESLMPYWKSPKLFENHLELPPDVFAGMSKGKRYFWMISAYLSDGLRVESDLEEFSLSR